MPAGATRGVAVVVGVGAGIGGSVAEEFAREGFRVAVFARNETYRNPKHRNKLAPALGRVEAAWRARLSENGQLAERLSTATVDWNTQVHVESELRVGGLPVAVAHRCDVTKREQVRDAFAAVRESFHGERLRVLVYNVGARRFQGEALCDLDLEEFEQFWRANCLGALLCMREVIPHMLEDKNGKVECSKDAEAARGTILLTGATGSIRASAGLASFSVGKFGLRALAQSAARELAPQGIHVAHVIIDGPVELPVVRKMMPADTPQTALLQPTDVARAYVFLEAQRVSAWTHELDLRPSVEPMFSKL